MTSNQRFVLATRIALLLVMAALMIRIAWMSDDAVITLRTALNITHGWGPGFNAVETVQGYTHPLWFLLWVVIGSVTNQWVLGILALSMLASMTAVGLIFWRTASIARLIGLTALLALSNAFMDYTSSGLENPLAYLTLGTVAVLTLRTRWSTATLVLLGLASTAVILTRLDLALIIAPVLFYLAWLWRRDWRRLAIAGAAIVAPLILWFVWSKVTYASWLPNTFEAKRNVNIPAFELVSQGFMYLWVSFEHDPVSLLTIVAGILLAFLLGPALLRMWATGMILYIAYMVWIGGDFMAGRFVAVVVYLSVFVLALVAPHGARAEEEQEQGQQPLLIVASITGALILLAGTVTMGSQPSSLSRITEPRFYDFNVADERGNYLPAGRDLMTLLRKTLNKYETAPREDDLYSINLVAATWPEREPGVDYTFATPNPGVYCMYAGAALRAGPKTFVLDNCGLTDRYIAGTPYTPEKPFRWRMGHFDRYVDGYWEAVAANDPSLIKDEAERERLIKLWDQIRPGWRSLE